MDENTKLRTTSGFDYCVQIQVDPLSQRGIENRVKKVQINTEGIRFETKLKVGINEIYSNC